MKYILVLIFVGLSSALFSQSITGGSGRCVVDSDPNTISALDSLNEDYDCLKVYNKVSNKYYYYDETQIIGSRWIEYVPKTDLSKYNPNSIPILSKHYRSIDRKTQLIEEINNTGKLVSNLLNLTLSSGRSAFQDASLVWSADNSDSSKSYSIKGTDLTYSRLDSVRTIGNEGDSILWLPNYPPLGFSDNPQISGLKLSDNNIDTLSIALNGSDSGSLLISTSSSDGAELATLTTTPDSIIYLDDISDSLKHVWSLRNEVRSYSGNIGQFRVPGKVATDYVMTEEELERGDLVDTANKYSNFMIRSQNIENTFNWTRLKHNGTPYIPNPTITSNASGTLERYQIDLTGFSGSHIYSYIGGLIYSPSQYMIEGETYNFSIEMQSLSGNQDILLILDQVKYEKITITPTLQRFEIPFVYQAGIDTIFFGTDFRKDSTTTKVLDFYVGNAQLRKGDSYTGYYHPTYGVQSPANATVYVLYDQVGGRHLIQTNDSKQPIVVERGNYIVNNGKRAMKLTSDQLATLILFPTPIQQPYHIFTEIDFYQFASFQYLFEQSSTSGSSQVRMNTGSSNRLHVFAPTYRSTTSSLEYDLNQNVYSMMNKSGSTVVGVNTSTETLSDAGANAINSMSWLSNKSGAGITGFATSLAIFRDDLTAQIPNIVSSIQSTRKTPLVQIVNEAGDIKVKNHLGSDTTLGNSKGTDDIALSWKEGDMKVSLNGEDAVLFLPDFTQNYSKLLFTSPKNLSLHSLVMWLFELNDSQLKTLSK